MAQNHSENSQRPVWVPAARREKRFMAADLCLELVCPIPDRPELGRYYRQMTSCRQRDWRFVPQIMSLTSRTLEVFSQLFGVLSDGQERSGLVRPGGSQRPKVTGQSVPLGHR